MDVKELAALVAQHQQDPAFSAELKKHGVSVIPNSFKQLKERLHSGGFLVISQQEYTALAKEKEALHVENVSLRKRLGEEASYLPSKAEKEETSEKEEAYVKPEATFDHFFPIPTPQNEWEEILHASREILYIHSIYSMATATASETTEGVTYRLSFQKEHYDIEKGARELEFLQTFEQMATETLGKPVRIIVEENPESVKYEQDHALKKDEKKVSFLEEFSGITEKKVKRVLIV